MRRAIGRAINQIVGVLLTFVVGTFALFAMVGTFLENLNFSGEKFVTYFNMIFLLVGALIFTVIGIYEYKRTERIKEAQRLVDQRRAKRERILLLEQTRIKKIKSKDSNADPYFLGNEFSKVSPAYNFNQEDFVIYFKSLELPNIPTSMNTIDRKYNSLMRKYEKNLSKNEEKKVEMIKLCYKKLKDIYPEFVE
ncbi:hypothetical protein SAMN04488048_11533 [Trichococcus flocculiformis]|uniref:hypothetical protein n=1 Tax=Trichococcus TaxID=82802 RepID=UPI0007A82A5D|nr:MULTISPECIES: hypothetical protein [Trichococcus]CZR05839.1 Hypothetical protein TES5_2229 [Trichococcus sp. ES5]SHF88331.1 hypothetical protein SAMN04488048_11533 [Trichococcus flocculiformis]